MDGEHSYKVSIDQGIKSLNYTAIIIIFSVLGALLIICFSLLTLIIIHTKRINARIRRQSALALQERDNEIQLRKDLIVKVMDNMNQ